MNEIDLKLSEEFKDYLAFIRVCNWIKMSGNSNRSFQEHYEEFYKRFYKLEKELCRSYGCKELQYRLGRCKECYERYEMGEAGVKV